MKKNPLRSAILAIGLAVAVIMLAGITRPHILDDLLAARQAQQRVLFGGEDTLPVEALVEKSAPAPTQSTQPVQIAAHAEHPLPLDLQMNQVARVPDYHDPILSEQATPPVRTAERGHPVNPITLEARLLALEIQVGSLLQAQSGLSGEEELVVRIYRPRHLPADEIRRLILPALTPGIGKLGLSKSQEPGGIISVRDRKPVLDRISELVAELDVPGK